MIYRTVTVDANLSGSEIVVTPELSGNVSADAEIVTKVRVTQYPDYSGEYEFTPTQETQTIPTDHTVLFDNITINPIPSNYGLITWNGATLTVS